MHESGQQLNQHHEAAAIVLCSAPVCQQQVQHHRATRQRMRPVLTLQPAQRNTLHSTARHLATL